MVGGEPVVLVNGDGHLYALTDQCSHEELPLSDGEVEGEVIVCQYHGARFDLASGAPRGLPAVKPVKSFAVEVRGDEIFVRQD
jgi:3-phenylpropionate/trans-cinnamate dioxygenase ferredoxin subunit